MELELDRSQFPLNFEFQNILARITVKPTTSVTSRGQNLVARAVTTLEVMARDGVEIEEVVMPSEKSVRPPLVSKNYCSVGVDCGDGFAALVRLKLWPRWTLGPVLVATVELRGKVEVARKEICVSYLLPWVIARAGTGPPVSAERALR